MRLITFSIVVLISWIADVAVAQTTSVTRLSPIILQPSGALPQEVAAGQIPATASSEVPLAAVAQESPEVTQKKQQMLLQLYFDRRSSSILRTWALPAEEAMKPV